MSPFCTKTINKNTNAPPLHTGEGASICRMNILRLFSDYSQTILRLFSDYSQTILRPDKTRVDQPTVLVG